MTARAGLRFCLAVYAVRGELGDHGATVMFAYNQDTGQFDQRAALPEDAGEGMAVVHDGLIHEVGHQLGLSDIYAHARRPAVFRVFGAGNEQPVARFCGRPQE